jgi:hypothetical protein
MFSIQKVLGQTESKDLTGHYVSAPVNKVELKKAYLSGEAMPVKGSELKLNKDSTYVYKTCGNIIKGKWRVSKDSLVLFTRSNRRRNEGVIKNDSDGKQPKVNKEAKPDKLAIQEDQKLKNTFEIKTPTGEMRKAYDLLVKDAETDKK